MEPTSAAPVLIEAYKAGGIVLLLLVGIGIIIYAVWRSAAAREERMAGALDKHQAAQLEQAQHATAALVNNTHAMNANTEVTKELCDVLRDRPCLKDPTPRSGSQIPRVVLVLLSVLLLGGCTKEQVERAQQGVDQAKAAVAAAETGLTQAEEGLGKAEHIARMTIDALELAKRIAEETKAEQARAAVAQAQAAVDSAQLIVSGFREAVPAARAVVDQAKGALTVAQASVDAAKSAQAAGGSTVDVIVAVIAALVPTAGPLLVAWLRARSTAQQLVGANGMLAVERDQARRAVELTAAHADRMEEAETDEDVAAAKQLAVLEQRLAGVRDVIAQARGKAA